MNANVQTSFHALADPTRRALFERLARRPLAVVDLAAGLPVSRPAVSQHLKVLKRAGLVRVAQEGTRRFYRADPKGVAVMQSYLDRLWDRSLASFKNFVEREETTRLSTERKAKR